MAHTPVLENIRRIVASAHASAVTGLHVEQVLENRAAACSRRQFIGRSIIGTAALAGSPQQNSGQLSNLLQHRLGLPEGVISSRHAAIIGLLQDDLLDVVGGEAADRQGRPHV